MSLWAIVPVKALDKSKSRLSSVLDPDERIELSTDMLTQTLRVLSEIPEIERTLVVSADPEALALAGAYGAQALEEQGSPELNQALEQATAFAREAQVDAVLILPADLPAIQVADVEALVRQAHDPPVVAISPDRRRTGTNALLIAPPGTLKYAFGPDSFIHHVRRAEAAHARIEVVDLPALRLDLDVPEDLEIFRDRYALIKE